METFLFPFYSLLVRFLWGMILLLFGTQYFVKMKYFVTRKMCGFNFSLYSHPLKHKRHLTPSGMPYNISNAILSYKRSFHRFEHYEVVWDEILCDDQFYIDIPRTYNNGIGYCRQKNHISTVAKYHLWSHIRIYILSTIS